VNQIYFEGYLRILTLKQLRPKSIREKLWRVYTFLIYTEFKETSQESIRCHRCGTINAHDSMFCKTCFQTMTDLAAKQINTMHQTVINNLDAITSLTEKEKAKIAADASEAKS